MYRRIILIGGVSAFALAACNAPVTDKTVLQVASDVNIIAAGLQGVLAQLPSVVTINANTLATAKAAIAGVQSVAVEIGKATDVAATQPLVQKLETYLNTLVGVLASVPLLPAAIATAMQAASILLPVIEALIGLVMQSSPRATPVKGMTPDEARLVLKAAAVSK